MLGFLEYFWNEQLVKPKSKTPSAKFPRLQSFDDFFKWTEAKLIDMKSVPQQGDSSSCGVASLWNAHLLAMYEAPFDGHDFYFPYKSSDLKTIRKVIALDLITNTLTLPPRGFDDKEEDVRMPDDDSPDDDKSSRVTVDKRNEGVFTLPRKQN